jgi:hypothetical protein
MVLIVEDGCTFCEPFKNIKDLTIAKLLSNVKPPMLELGGVKMPLPFRLVGLPTLVDGEKIYVGRGPVQDRLEQARNGK